MLLTIVFSLYPPMWQGNYVDAVYWVDYTLLMIGSLGSDYPLRTTAGRMCVIPCSAFGILLAELAVTRSVRALVLEGGRERERWRAYIVMKRGKQSRFE